MTSRLLGINLTEFSRLKILLENFFFGNHFYGLCATLLSYETIIKFGKTNLNFEFFVLIYLSTVIFYNLAYLKTEQKVESSNYRATWYKKHFYSIRNSTFIYFSVLVIILFQFVFSHYTSLFQINLSEFSLISIFLIVPFSYYGCEEIKFNLGNIRRIGWLKPFIIAGSWSGAVTFYPLIYFSIKAQSHLEFTTELFMHFILNLIFISALCIMFDIKDYAMDYNQKLKTFVVKFGLKKTVSQIILPIILSGILISLSVSIFYGKNIYIALFSSFPYLFLIPIANGLLIQRSIFYYLILIDGMIVIKAISGIIIHS